MQNNHSAKGVIFSILSLACCLLCFQNCSNGGGSGGTPSPSVQNNGNSGTCYTTGISSPLQVCHSSSSEGLYYQPTSQPSTPQIAYNVQIMQLSSSIYATILHSESRNMSAYFAQMEFPAAETPSKWEW